MGRANRSHIGAAAIVLTLCATSANAGTITAFGNVAALTNLNQLGTVIGTADFTFPGGAGPVPLDLASGLGMTFHTGPLTAILPGVTSSGSASQPQYTDDATFTPGLPTWFPSPAGGGVGNFDFQIFGGVVTFSKPVARFGLTFSRNGTQYITAWSTTGQMLGEVRWDPNGDSSFVGIDTFEVPIGMLAVGNDDLFHGASYDIGGATIITDSWQWARPMPEPATMSLLTLGLGAAWIRRRRAR